MDEIQIRKIDAQFDQSLVEWSDRYFEQYMHPNFVWVHNHATLIQRSRDEFLEMGRKNHESGRPSVSIRREQSNVVVLVETDTAIAYGYTSVERSENYVARTGSRKYLKYHFMRTYARLEDSWWLLANHTMEVWSGNEPAA
ncbi:MAG: nuclear transport factor 2 family protein [Pseudomonadota bacterium]